MTGTPAEQYAELVRAAEEHQRALRAASTSSETDRWKTQAPRYREDPFRELCQPPAAPRARGSSSCPGLDISSLHRQNVQVELFEVR